MSDDVPAFTLQVGSRWPAYDADNLIQITLIQRGLAEGFLPSHFRPSGNTDRTEMGTRLRFGCAYTYYTGAEGSCADGFDLDPDKDEEFPCMRVTKVCLEHDHPHDLSRVNWEKCKQHEEEYLPKGIAAVQTGAIERLTSLRKTLDYRCAMPDSFKDYLDRSIREQELIIKIWEPLPDARVRAELRQKAERILIRRENYRSLPPLPTRGGGTTASSSRRPVSRASGSSSVSTRASQALAPGLARKVKRAAPPSPEAKPARKDPRRKVAQPPTVEERATPPASGSSTPAAGSSGPQVGQRSNRGMPSPVAPVETIDLRDASDEEIEPEPRTAGPLPHPTPPAADSAHASLAQLERQDPAPLSPATPAAPTPSSKLADFLSSLEPDCHLER